MGDSTGNVARYFNRGRGGGRGYGKTPANGGANNAGAENGPPAKKKKFNPFWRARGGGGRGGWGGFGWNRNPLEKPVSVRLPTVDNGPKEGTSQIDEVNVEMDLMDIDIEEDILLGPVKQISVLTDCLGNKNYQFWRLYFPFLEYDDDLPQRKHISAFEKYYEDNWLSVFKDDVLKTHAFLLSYKALVTDREFMHSFPDFIDQLKNEPDNVLQSAAIAMHQTLQRKNLDHERLEYHTRLIDFQPVTSLERAMDTQNIDTMVSIRCTVMRVSDPEYHSRWSVFQCSMCKKEQMIFQPNGRCTMPMSCYDGCRARSRFETLLKSPFHIIQPYQQLRVQESIYCGKLNNSVNYIAVALHYDLVDSVGPGDDVILTGVLKVTREPSAFNNGSLTPKEYIEATSVVGAKHTVTVQRSHFTEKDMRAIETIRNLASPFRLLVNSLNPRIFGHEMVKAGLILSLLGGGEGRTTRDNIHVLMVGDPGMGKSELMRACVAVAPKAIYSISSHLSGAGLTASVRRSENRFMVEAGALVLADGGICCIDEIDKKVSMHSDLLDAMERQKVSVVKMGNRVNLTARTTIIAAGNPVGNIYDKTKTISENLKIGPALLSRFDLVYIMVDSVEHKTRMAQQRLLQGLTNSQNHPTMNELMDQRKVQGLFPTFSVLDSVGYQSKWALEDFLRMKPNEPVEPLPEILLQNYIGYARKNCNPTISEPAAELIKNFYLDMREMEKTSDILPVTIRQLQALRRLAVARARADLASEVTIQHVNEIIELTKFSMHHALETENGELDLSRGMHGSGVSKRNKKMHFLQILKKKYEQTGVDTYSMDQLKKIASDLQLDNIYDVVDSLNNQGFLLMLRTNVYKIITN